jgi:hypothetical protein
MPKAKPMVKLIWTAVTWALGLGPLSLMAHGLPLHAGKRLIGTHLEDRTSKWQRPTYFKDS